MERESHIVHFYKLTIYEDVLLLAPLKKEYA